MPRIRAPTIQPRTLLNWKPKTKYQVKSEDLEFIRTNINVRNWKKDSFHLYFKSLEQFLLKSFRDTINTCHIKKSAPNFDWVKCASTEWMRLALMRDYHDHMCGRYDKHYIRTDDCRRFIECALKGLKTKIFSKPVHRILCGENAPRQFIHPLFTRFN
jgi:hypothetical protein